MKRIVLIVCFLAAATASAWAKEQYVYTQISREEGLNSTVNCIYKEKDGDVWIGTPTGLYSFDGYTLRGYAGQLSGSRHVYQICTDSTGDLWVLTDRHFIRRDYGSDIFEKAATDSLVQNPFYCMLPDDKGIWVGGSGKLYRYGYADRTLRLFCTTSDDFDIQYIGAIDSNTLLCASHSGKILVDTTTGEVSAAPYGERNEVSAALIDSKGRIWLAFYNNGIEVFEKDGTRIKSYNTSNSQLSKNIVLCMTEHGSSVLAGTNGGGINIIDIETDRIKTLSHIPGDRLSFPAQSIKSIHTDHYGYIWAGSIHKGLISVSQSDINSYQDTRIGLTNGLSNPTVLCLHQGRTSDYIWIGTDGEGINRFDPHTSRFTHFSSTLGSRVVSIADYSATELALSVYADNIWIFDKLSGTLRPLGIDDKDFLYKIRYSGRDIHIYNENDGDLLFLASGVHRYDKRSRKCVAISDPAKKVPNSTYSIIGRSEEGVWIHNRLNVYLLPDNDASLIFKGKHENGDIRCGHIGADGTIWMATEEGLCNFNTQTGTFGHIQTMLFSDANSVVCDNSSRVWVGTEKGLSAYLVESGCFTIFDESDGVKPNKFLPAPHLLSTRGDVYFGGVDGMLRIRDNHVIDTSDDPKMKLNELLVNGEEVEIPADGIFKATGKSKKLAFRVSIHDKDMLRHRMYRFALSDKQVYETSTPFFSLRLLPKPGTYHMTVSCTKRTGEWTEPFSMITLKVPTPWFRSWWFLGICILTLALVYFLVFYTIQKRKTSQLKMAMKEREQKMYEEKVNMLINISHELRTPLTLIMAPLKRVLKAMDHEDINFPVLSRIHRQSRRMRNLLDMVLDLRKMEVEGDHLKTERTDFNRWIAATADDIVNEEKSEGIDIVYDFDADIDSAEIDIKKCDIILMNILINAIKHSSAGDVITIRTRLLENGMIRTSVSDQGPGLGKDVDPEKLFHRFYQSASEKYGSGIGLSYSKILVEMHGGQIGVFNNPDKGATFWWDLPVCSADSGKVESRAYLNELLGHSSEADISDTHAEEFSTKGISLMLVDDNKDLLDFLHEALCQDFAEIITVSGGKAAVRALIDGKSPDIIVSDVNMPDGDGFWLCNELKKSEKYSHIPFVLLTARGEDQSQSESYRLGADGFLAKPFEIETLMELIRSLMRSKAEIRKRYLSDNADVAAEYGSDEERFIIQLNKVIADNIGNPDLDQQLLCRELGMSRALLYNKMKAITGSGVKEYITRIRIEKAKALIENTSHTLAEISEMTGFASQSYFSTAFKNYEGVSPSQFKQNHRKM